MRDAGAAGSVGRIGESEWNFRLRIASSAALPSSGHRNISCRSFSRGTMRGTNAHHAIVARQNDDALVAADQTVWRCPGIGGRTPAERWGELAMTFRVSAVAVCRSSASLVSLNSRAFSIAITA